MKLEVRKDSTNYSISFAVTGNRNNNSHIFNTKLCQLNGRLKKVDPIGAIEGVFAETCSVLDDIITSFLNQNGIAFEQSGEWMSKGAKPKVSFLYCGSRQLTADETRRLTQQVSLILE